MSTRLIVGNPALDCENCAGDPEWEAEGTGYPCACRAQEAGELVLVSEICQGAVTVTRRFRPDPERMVAAIEGVLRDAPVRETEEAVAA